MSGTELGTALQIRPYTAEDEPAVIALLVGALGEGPSGHRTPAFFRWKHLENPFGESLLLVAELDGEIVGLRAFLRWGFTIGDRSLRAVRAVDTATRHDQRGKGIFSTLTKAALAELRTDTDLVFNTPNGSSRPGYLKMGWQEVGRVPVWVKVRRPVAFARGLRSTTSVTDRPIREINVTAPLAADALGDEDELRAFLGELGHPAERIATPYSPEYLAWRYARAPLGYRAIVARTAGRHRGDRDLPCAAPGNALGGHDRRAPGPACRQARGRGPHRSRQCVSAASITSRATSPPVRHSSPRHGGGCSSGRRKVSSS